MTNTSERHHRAEGGGVMECPHCDKPIALSAKMIEQERFTMSIAWEGDYVEAMTVAGIIENTRIILAESAKDVGGEYAVMMDGIDWGHKQAKFHFLLIAKPAAPKEDA